MKEHSKSIKTLNSDEGRQTRVGGSTALSGNNTINKLMDRVISKIVKLGYASCDNFRYNTPIRLLIVQYTITFLL